MATRTSQTHAGARPASRRSLWKDPKVIGGALAALALVAALAVYFWPDQPEPAVSHRDQAEDTPRPLKPLINPADVKIPAARLRVLSVITSEPGFFVLVNDEPARSEKGVMLQTPCEIQLETGSYTVRVARRGFEEQSEQVLVEENAEVRFDSLATDDTSAGILSAPFFELEPGQPVPLETVNSPARELDPYLEPDGLTLWFVSERIGAAGLYRATRPSVYHPFETPEYLPESAGSGLPASPSVVTGNWRGVVFATPETGRVIALTLEQIETLNVPPKVFLLARKDGLSRWPSAQTVEEGRRIYWVADENGTRRTYTSTRKDLKSDFTRWSEITLPGTHPCLSSDGLRQYVYDGQKLQRARRGGLEEPFSDLELVRELPLINYVPDTARRPWFISDDEQWMVYSTGADLFLVRLSPGRGWGTVPRGKPLEVRPETPPPMPSTEPVPEQPVVTQPAVDPRTLPLPYLEYRANFEKLLRSGDSDGALRLVQEALQDKKFLGYGELLRWDQEEATNLAGFWTLARQIVAALPVGQEIRIGTVKVEFVKLENDILQAKSRTGAVEKKLQELRPVDLLAVIDSRIPADDAAKQVQVATWMFYHPESSEEAAVQRFRQAGSPGQEFLDRRPERALHLAKAEMHRGNAGPALKHIREVLEKHADSTAATQAKSLEAELYTLAKWTPERRIWITDTPGEYQADTNRTEGAYLRSEQQYQSFDLSLEWKIEGGFGQGGVFFHYPGSGPVFDTSYKIHLAGPGTALDAVTTGALYKLQAPTVNAAKPAGQWNTLRMKVQGPKVQVEINGQKVLDATAQELESGANQRMPARGTKGYILLDGVVGGITYRKILLVELPPDPAAVGPMLKEDTPQPEQN